MVSFIIGCKHGHQHAHIGKRVESTQSMPRGGTKQVQTHALELLQNRNNGNQYVHTGTHLKGVFRMSVRCKKHSTCE